MVKPRTRQPSQEQIDQFARGAEVTTQKSEQPKASEKTYKRVTFSLTEHDDQLVDELSLKVRSFRCNRSQAVKAALAFLAAQDDDTIIKELEKQKGI
ncbi:hypothetical protein [Photobacterium sp. TY1-4]|uniref:hypothetical protein n=1 Tax=Photobacterium sp. TY1-4 TaxID=2899122 RepID=UPI0021C0C804|nr:hypothetical protein [Photobacterium sp. TY1-4]UXI04721.1 hypothetical protein NH461_25710 [Photobacterium sp. TY1-4]